MAVTAADISTTQLAQWAQDFTDDAAARLAQNAVTQNPVSRLAQDPGRAAALEGATFSLKVDKWEVSNQKQSGRCWMFAGYNAAGRPGVLRATGLENFEFSFAYLQFFDQLEKANVFLVHMEELADVPFPGEFLTPSESVQTERDARTVATMLESPVGDGGWWTSFTNLVKKYGAVPKYAMPETESSSNTKEMHAALVRRLRRAAWEMHTSPATERPQLRTQALADVYRILRIHLGTPPEKFMWQWEDKDGKFHREGELTPQEFAARTLPDLDDYLCLLADPRLTVGESYVIDRSESMLGKPQVFCVVPMEVLQSATVATLREGEPVWMACDVGQDMDRKKGIGDPHLFARGELYGVDMSLERHAGICTKEYLPTHAMAFTGVDLVDEVPQRWRIENSWGEENGAKGYFTVSDAWFTEHTYLVVVKENAIPAKWRERVLAAAQATPHVLPIWDVLS